MVGKGRSGRKEEEYVICDSEYGKSAVRLLHISRSGPVHSVRELEVTTRLTLATKKEYLDGNNQDIVSTDSQKITVYILAKKYGVSSPEEFAILLSQFFLDKFSHVVESSATVVEFPWDRLQVNDVPHNHAFVHQPVAERWASVKINRKDPPLLKGGLRGLRILKTTKSCFKNFIHDEFRRLEDADDRVFSTIVAAEWLYSSHLGVDFDNAWEKVLDSIYTKFAGPPEKGILSPSVQHTLYLACTMALDSIPQISRIQMDMPNKHYLDIDLSSFPKEYVGSEVNKTVFLPIEKPAGFIHAAVERKTSKL